MRRISRADLSLVAGFVIIGFAIFAVALVGYQQLENLRQRVDRILFIHDQKIELVHELRNVVRERMVRMNLMLVTTDPFERDRAFMEFVALGERFIVIRRALDSHLSGAEEIREAAKLRDLASRTTDVHSAVIEQSLAGNFATARELMVNHSLPLQQSVVRQGDHLLEVFQREDRASVAEGVAAYREMRILMGSLTVGAIVLTALIGFLVGRRIAGDRARLVAEIEERRRAEKELLEMKVSLEKMVEQRTAELKNSLDRLDEAQRIGGIGHWDWNVVENTLYWSDQVYRIFGVDPQSFPATYEAFCDCLHPDDREWMMATIAKAMTQREAFQVTHRVLRPNGETRVVHGEGATTFDPAGNPVRMLGTVRDVTDEKAAEERLWHLAHHDTLSGLPNRTLLLSCTAKAISRCDRSGRPVAVLLCDLDRFKQVNDSLGHSAGDQLIRQVAERLQGCTRETDLVARFAGDEFVLLLEDLTAPEDAAIVANKIVEVLRHPFELDRGVVSIGVSVGIAVYPHDGRNVDELLRQADRAMYQAKGEGRGRYCYFDPEAPSPMCELV